MAILIALFFLILPVLLMMWMLVARRRVQAVRRPEADLPPAEPWEETVKLEGGLAYVRRHHPNEELADADGRAEDARMTQVLGIGL